MKKFVLVTGVSSGIGYGIAHDLVSRGYHVLGSVRKESDGQRLQAELGPAFTPLHFDVTDVAAIAVAVQQVGAIVGTHGLAGLVNNAGVSATAPLMLQPLDEVRWIFEVNVIGVIAVTQAFLPLLGAREGALHAPGRIVNIGSVGGMIAAPFMGAYAGTKHALEAVTQVFRRELKIYGIEVSAVEPSFIKSEIYTKSATQSDVTRYDGTGFAAMWKAFLISFMESERTADSVDLVTTAVYDALTRKKPKTRYPLHPIWRIGQVLSDRQFDRLIFKVTGIDKVLRQKSAEARAVADSRKSS